MTSEFGEQGSTTYTALKQTQNKTAKRPLPFKQLLFFFLVELLYFAGLKISCILLAIELVKLGNDLFPLVFDC